MPGHGPDFIVYASAIKYEPPDDGTIIDPTTKKRLLDQFRAALRARGMTLEVEE